MEFTTEHLFFPTLPFSNHSFISSTEIMDFLFIGVSYFETFPIAIYFRVYILLALFLVIFACYYYVTNCSPKAKMINKFPEFVHGMNVWEISRQGVPNAELGKLLTESFQKNGKTIQKWGLHIPFMFTSDLAVVEKVLSSPKHVLKGDLYKLAKPWMGYGLVTSLPHIWRKDRKLLSTAFKTPFYEDFMQIFNNHSRTLINTLAKKYPNGNEVTNLHPDIGRCALAIICETALDIKTNPEEKLFETMCSVVQLILTAVYKPWFTLKFIWEPLGYGKLQRQVDKAIDKLIPNDLIVFRRNKLNGTKMDEETDKSKEKFLNLLIRHNYSSTALKTHVISIMGAGFETTAAAMNHFLFLMGCHPEIQKKVYEEICNTLGSDFERDVTMSDLNELKYLEMCLKESMRIYPTAPILGRKVQSDIVVNKDKGLIIPSGANVLIVTWDVHHDPNNYENPYIFDPDRFLPENSAKRSLYSYLPFSAGPRNCLGQKYVFMEMKVMLAHIMRNFEIITTQKMEDMRFKYGIVIHPDGEMYFTLKPRRINNYLTLKLQE